MCVCVRERERERERKREREGRCEITDLIHFSKFLSASERQTIVKFSFFLSFFSLRGIFMRSFEIATQLSSKAIDDSLQLFLLTLLVSSVLKRIVESL